jgi:hypothetical protein
METFEPTPREFGIRALSSRKQFGCVESRTIEGRIADTVAAIGLDINNIYSFK